MNTPFEFSFEVKKLLFTDSKSKFMIIQTKILEVNKDINLPKEMTVQGVVPVAYKKDVFDGKGIIKTHPIYGRYIELQGTPKLILPQVESALVEFLQRRVKGVGRKKANMIVTSLGLDAITRIEKDKQALITCGFSDKEAVRIRESLIYHRKFEDLVHFLQSIQIEVDIAIDIYNSLKDVSVPKIRSNPYVISGQGKVTWLHADRIAKKLSFLPHFKPRYRHAILYYMDIQTNNEGNLCVPFEKIIQDFSLGDFLKKHGSYPDKPHIPADTVKNILNELIVEGILISRENKDGKWMVYKPSYHYIEESIIRGLDRIHNGYRMPFASNNDIQRFIDEYEQQFFKLASEQQEAIRMALKHPISILTGGPGTGKTHTTNAIVKCIKSIKPRARITLLAPTGKAAKRLSEMTGMKAKTIHRGLGIKGFGVEEELTKLDSDFVIVDESSMVDAYLSQLLFQQIGDETRLLLVGDYHQLPSVGPGLILRDLIHSNRIPVTELTTIFRQAKESQIVLNAHKMQQGKTTTMRNGLTFDSKKGDSYFVQRTQPLKIQADVIETMKRFMNKGYKLEDILVLSPKHSGLLGKEELNRQIQKAFNPPTNLIEITKNNGEKFRVGDRVIQTENNYDLKVFNGEIGTVYDIYYRRDNGVEELILSVEFPDRDSPVEFHETDYEELELAYCITIHKSQGSESPVVIMPIHTTQGKMLDRTLVYTGYTRAKGVHVFLGEQKLLNEAIERKNTDSRHSMIREKIELLL